MDSITSTLGNYHAMVDISANIEKEIKKTNKKSLVFIYNPDCSFCVFVMSQFTPALKKLDQMNEEVRVFGINVQKEPKEMKNSEDFLRRNGVLATPSFLRFDPKGQKSESFPSAIPKTYYNLVQFALKGSANLIKSTYESDEEEEPKSQAKVPNLKYFE